MTSEQETAMYDQPEPHDEHEFCDPRLGCVMPSEVSREELIEKAAKAMMERFWSKVEPTGFCWNWTGGLNPGGYGRFFVGSRRNVAAHRFAYETLVGPIPDGLKLDHLCRNRACVNPDHTEPVTDRVNTLRGFGPSALNARATHCVEGHEFSNVNTYVNQAGSRVCRECMRAAQRAWAKEKYDRDNPPKEPATQCINGHPLSGDNLYVDSRGWRVCHTCKRDRKAAARRKEKES